MGRNLTNLYISSSFEFLTQISGSELQTGLGTTITGSLLITASRADNATSASYSNVATSASYALVSTTSSFAINANSASYALNSTSASYAITASFALNAGNTVSTASLLTTASAANNIITFTKGDGSTFPVTVATGSGGSAFPFTGSAQITGSLGVTGSINNTSILANGLNNTNTIIGRESGLTLDSANSLNNVVIGNSALSSSTDGSTNIAIGNSTLQKTTGLSRGNIAIGNQALKNATSSMDYNIAIGSNALINYTGSNRLFIEGNTFVGNPLIQGEFDTDRLSINQPNLYIANTTLDVSGSVLITGSIAATTGFTGSLLGTASYASYADTSSYTPNALITASVSSNVLTFTKGDSSTFTLTVNTGSGGGGASTTRLQNQTIASGSWGYDGSYYTSSFSNANISASTVIDFTPYNASVYTVLAARIQPYISSSAGECYFYSQYAPSNDITGDILITPTI